jgi:hypothetical protein
MEKSQLEETRKALIARRDKLDAWEAKLSEREAKLIDNVTMQAISIILLRTLRKNGKIKPAHLNEIRFAPDKFQNDEYNPKRLLDNVLQETFLDREERIPTPREISDNR